MKHGSLRCVAGMRYRHGGERTNQERARLYVGTPGSGQARDAANVTRLSLIEPLDVKNAVRVAPGFTNERDLDHGSYAVSTSRRTFAVPDPIIPSFFAAE